MKKQTITEVHVNLQNLHIKRIKLTVFMMRSHEAVIIFMKIVVVFKCMTLNTRVISQEDFG